MQKFNLEQKINLKQIILIVMLIFSSLLTVYTQGSIPLSAVRNQQFQTRSASLWRTYLSPIQTIVTFNTAKTLSPLIILSIREMNYDLNYDFGSPNHILNFEIGISSSSLIDFIAQCVTTQPQLLANVVFFYLAIDGSFSYISSINVLTQSSFIPNNPQGYFTATSYPIIKVFIQGVAYEITDWGYYDNHYFDIQWGINFLTSTNFQLTMYTYSSYQNSLSVAIKIIIIYTINIPQYKYSFQGFEQYFNQGICNQFYISYFPYYTLFQYYYFQLGEDYIDITTVVYGLKSFQFVAQHGESFNFYLNFYHDYNNFQIHRTSYFHSLSFDILMINKLACEDLNYKIVKFNPANNRFQCYDRCTEYQYEQVNTDLFVYCKPCTATGCLKCKSDTNCYECLPEYDISSTGTCSLNEHYALSGGSIYFCSSLMTNCVTCSDNSTCTSCQNGAYLSGTSCDYCYNPYSNCVSCTTSRCLQCAPGYFLVNNGLNCTNSNNSPPGYPPCIDSRCKICNFYNLFECFGCVDNEMFPVNGVCTDNCGDGKITGPETCDDENSQSSDGCSSLCQIQSGYICTTALFSPTSKYYKSTCVVNAFLTFKVNFIQKSKNMNKVQIKMQILPPIKQEYWDNLSVESMITLSGEVRQNTKKYLITRNRMTDKTQSFRRLLQTSNTTQNDSIQAVYMYLDYNQTLQDKLLTVTLNPTSSGLAVLSLCSSYTGSFTLKSRNNHFLNYYSEQSYSSMQIIKSISFFVGLSAFFMIILGIFAGSMNVIFEFSGIFQLTYFSLLEVGELNPLVYGLTNLKYSSGYNLPINFSNPVEDLLNSKILIGVEMFSSFSDNVNISLILIILSILIGLTLKLVKKVVNFEDQKLKKIVL